MSPFKRSPGKKGLNSSEFGENVILLHGEKQVNDNQRCLVDILRQTRCEQFQDLSDEQKEHLMEFHLDHERFTDQARNEIDHNSLHVFANKDPNKDHNRMRLQQLHTSENPAAKIISTTIGCKISSGYLVRCVSFVSNSLDFLSRSSYTLIQRIFLKYKTTKQRIIVVRRRVTI